MTTPHPAERNGRDECDMPAEACVPGRLLAENQRLREGIGVAAETLRAWLEDDGSDEAAAPERAEAALRALLSTSSVRGEGDE